MAKKQLLTPRYVLPAFSTCAWVLCAYWRLRPPSAVTSNVSPRSSYWPWAYGHLSYSDLVALYGLHHLGSHAAPYVHTPIEYPVLIGLFMWSMAWAPGVQGYFVASTIALLACAIGIFHLLHEWSPRHAWIFALSPLLLVYSLLNWDLLAILLMVLGWMQYRRRRYLSAGALLSLGVSTKLFPIMLLVYCLVSLLGDRRSPVARRGAIAMSASAVLTGIAVNLPFVLTNYEGWSELIRFNADRGDREGLLSVLHLVTTSSTLVVDAVSAGLVLVVMALLVPHVLRGGSPASAAAVAFAAFLLLNKVYSPQYMLWVFVFALLAEWPSWTLWMITGAGLVDYANAMFLLHLASIRSPSFPWYDHTVVPVNRGVRMGAIAGGALAAAHQALQIKARSLASRSRAVEGAR